MGERAHQSAGAPRLVAPWILEDWQWLMDLLLQLSIITATAAPAFDVSLYQP